MKIGIIFPMIEEIEALKKYLTIEKEKRIFDLIFYEGMINNTKCILVKSGVGKVNASRTTQILIDNYDLDYILNVGVAGGVSKDLSIGDIVVAERLYQYDFDITAFDHPLGYIPNIGNFIISSEFLVQKSKGIKLPGIKYGNIATGDKFCTELKESERIHEKFNALCVEMEGAAIAQVCTLCNIPFLVIRSISDTPGNNNQIIYEEFLDESCCKVALFVNEMIKLL